MSIHVVKAGDSVYSIATNYGVTQQRIIDDNGLTNPDRLVVGQTLVILTPSGIYDVKPGDTLFSISRETGISVKQLLRNNPQVSLRGTLYAGDELVTGYVDEKKGGQMAVIGYAYPHIDRVTLRRTLPYLTYISIFTYGFDSDGNLTTIDDEPIIAEAKEYGVAPLMVLSTMSPDGMFSSETANVVLNDATKKQNLINNIMSTVKAKGYAGIDLDFEYLKAGDADAYAAFVQEVRIRASAEENPVFVALAPKTSAEQPGVIYEAHDYRALGKAADRVLLMTYEWGYTYGPPMAVSPIEPVRKVIEYAITEIAPQKILMGMSNYGYDWQLPYVRGETVATTVGNVGAVDLAYEKSAAISYDYEAQAPFFYYYNPDGTRHIVWFEDARSINARLQLVPEYGLYGVGFWNLMRFFPQSWMLINSQYNIAQA